MHKTIHVAVLFAALLLSGTAYADQAVNINEDDGEALAETLEGVGEARAAAIVEFREENGGFETADDLVLVSGIGETTVDRNRDRIEVD